MKTEELTNEQRLSIALKEMHDTMLREPIGYNNILSILKQHRVKNVSPVAVILKKKNVIKRVGRAGRGSTYCWSDGVNSNLPLAKRVYESAQQYIDGCNERSLRRRMAKITPPSMGAATLFPDAQSGASQINAEEIKKHLSALEKQIREIKSDVRPTVELQKPRKRIRFQSPIMVSFSVNLRKMIYFV